MNENGNLRVRELLCNARAALDELERLCDQEQVCSCEEAALYLGVTRSTISRYIALGKLHKIKRGTRIGIASSELYRLKKR